MIRLASTVMLVRRTANEPVEVFMLRRSAKSAFAPDVFVFPGGTVDESDYSASSLDLLDGISNERLERMFRAQRAAGLDDPEQLASGDSDRRALLIAAFRELYEEAGVLLGATGVGEIDAQRLHEGRRKVFDGTVSFAELLRELDLRLDAGGIELFSQWITPPSEGRRFNAHFFIARADEQTAIADRYETHDEVWIAPKAALERYAAGTYAMVYPTIKHVERLAEFNSVDELLAFAKEKPILRIMPHTTADNGFTLPRALERAW